MSDEQLRLLELCELDNSDPDRPTALCQHCGLRLPIWELDPDGCCTDCHDPRTQTETNRAGFAAARAALQQARATAKETAQ